MRHERIARIRRARMKRITLKTSRLPIDCPGKYPMTRAFAALELEGKDTEESARWIVAYGFERAMLGEFRFMKEIIDTIDGPV
jgi:hypothetical protein